MLKFSYALYASIKANMPYRKRRVYAKIAQIQCGPKLSR